MQWSLDQSADSHLVLSQACYKEGNSSHGNLDVLLYVDQEEHVPPTPKAMTENL